MAQENGRQTRFSLREALPWLFNNINLNPETMTHFGREIMKSGIRRTIQQRISVVLPCVLRLLHRFPSCYGRNRYRMLSLPSPAEPPPSAAVDVVELGEAMPPSLLRTSDLELESDLVALKITLLGDCQIGKTSFLVKYVGNGNEEKWKHREGLNQIDKTLVVGGARISYSIWEVAGDGKSEDQIPLACKDSVAILIMFDLTSRCTLSSVLGWYREARKWNQSAIPVLVGTKFDDFIQLPMDLQWAIASQARAYAKALNATLFFSSATYNINVNKIFKFITAKLFDLSWTVERNLTVGEPMIDF